MPKFTVQLSRRFIQHETAIIQIEAPTKTEARKLAQQRQDEDGIDWEPSDSEYDHYGVEDVALT